MNNCEINRREFMATGVSGLIGTIIASQMNLPIFGFQTTGKKKAKYCILLWMGGGPSQIDTFDLKPGKETGGPFKDIKTAVSGIHISEHMPLLAEQAKNLAIIRSITTKEGNHDRASYLVHTGYVPQLTVQYPSLGSIISFKRGDNDFDLPNFISIGGASTGAGMLGTRYNPFVIQNPNKPPDNLHPQGGFSEKRLVNRLSLLEQVEKEFAKSHGSNETDSHQEIYKKASKMMTSKLSKAFDLTLEKDSLRKDYGKSSNFGQGCLLARRLIETGVKFVEVTLRGWDTHQNNFDSHKRLMEQLDPGFSTLIKDLKERGLLDETLIVWMGEFGRTPRINRQSGRDHFPRAWSVVLAGGGIQGGQVIGATDDSGMEVKDRPIKIQDLFASMLHAFGIDYTEKNMTPLGRPITLVDKDAQVIKELFT